MKAKPGDTITTDFELPDGYEPASAAVWTMQPAGMGHMTFDDDPNRLHPIVQVGRRPGVIAISGSVTAEKDGGSRTFHRGLVVEVADAGGSVAALKAEVAKPEAPQPAAGGRKEGSASEPAPKATPAGKGA